MKKIHLNRALAAKKKKLTLLFALLCASMMSWAGTTPYCGTTSPNAKFTFSLSNVSGNLYRIQFDAVGEEKFGSSPYNINCGVNQSAGAGIFFGGDNSGNWIMTDDRAYFDFSTASETSVPTEFYGNYFCFNKKGGGLIEISTFNPTDIDWKATCGASCDDSQKPSVTDVNVGDIAYNSAVLTITANDNIGVTRYVVKNGDVQLAQGASNVIILTGLTSSTAYDNIKVFAYDACNNESDAFSVSSFNTEALTYCRFATGHLGQANFGDQFGRILLTIKKVNETTIAVKVEPNNNGTRGIKYMNIIVNGTGHEFGNNDGSGEDLTGFYEISGLASLDFTFNLSFYCNTPNWTTNQFNVTAAELCEETTELSVGSEYCTYYGDGTKTGSRYATLTWETNEDGDVVITIGDGPDESNTTYRGDGLGNDLSGFTVLSGTGFATSEPASDYFNRVYGGSGSKTYILQKKGGVTLPSPAKIHFQGKAFEWKCTEEGNAYTNPTFEYTYGKICSQLDAPTNVKIDAGNILTFDAVAGADSYMAYVSLGGVEKYSQAVASGDALTYTALVTGDYIINVVASGAGKTDSDPSADVVWHLEAAPVVLGNSEYCEHTIGSGNQQAYLTWETDGSGNIVITISEALGGTAADTHFRGNGMALENFQVGAGKADASTYFNHACGGSNQVTLSLKDPGVAPSLGEKIYFTNKVVEYTTSQNNNAYSNMTFEWTYGTVCSGKSVSASVNNNTMGSAVVQKAGVDVTNVDAGDEVSFIATSADPALYRFVNWTKGGVEVSTNATYVTTITETTNLVANFDYIRESYCHYEVLATGGAAVGKKLYLTVGATGVAGQYQIKYEGSAEAPLTALNNANFMVNNVTTDIVYNEDKMTGGDVPFNKANGRWIFNASGNGSAQMVFTLAEGKTINDIFVWSNSVAFATPLGELVYEDNQTRLGLFGNPAPLRHNIDWDATCSDTEAPAFNKAEAEVLNESSVRLKIQATDNWGGLLTYTIARADASDIILNGASGAELTQEVTGLTTNTEYDFTITVSDGVNDAVTHIVVTPIADNVKPVMGEASLESKTWNSAIINVTATDNKGVTAYRLVNVDPVIDAEYVAEDGKITVEGLTANTAYSFTITAKDAAGNESANSQSVVFTTNSHDVVPTTAAPDPTWPANQVKSLYSNAYTFAPASLNSYNEGWYIPPTMVEENIGGDNYLRYHTNMTGIVGWQFGQISVATMEYIHVDIWPSEDGTITMGPTSADPTQVAGVTLNVVAGQWNSFDISIAELQAANASFDVAKVFQNQFTGYSAQTTFSVDNVYFYRTTPPPADLAAPTNVSASKVAEGFYSVQISAQAEDNSGAVTFKVKNGDVEVATGVAASGATTIITINNLTPGTNYNFSVVASDEAGNEVAPVPVAAQTKALPALAPAPDFRAKQIVPVFTDATTCVVTGIHSGGWGETTTAQWLDIAANDKVFYVQNFNFAGWHSWGGGNINATGMQYLHVDVYSIGATSVNVTPISPGHEGSATITLTPNAWTSYDVPLSAYDANNIDWANIFQFKFMDPVSGNELMIDNVYFWKEPDFKRDESTGDDWMAPGELGTICIPNGAVATGGDIYELVGKNEVGKIVFATVPNNEMEPGKPYLFQAKSYAMNFYYTSAAPAGEPNNSGAMKGTFDEVTLMGNQLNNVYYFSGHALWSCVDLTATGLHVSAYRAWVVLDEHMPTISTSNPAPGRRYIYMGVNGQNATTGFGEVQGDDQQSTKVLINGHLFIRRGEKTYDATGRLVK